jgi:hypothetical protein
MPFSSGLAQAAAPQFEGWQPTGITLPQNDYQVCFDATRPNTLLLAISSAASSSGQTPGTYSVNWISGQQTKFSNLIFEACDPYNGLLFGRVNPNQPGNWMRFSLSDPAGKPVEHLPNGFASDGSLRVYGLESSTHKLWASSDDGLTWQERSPDLPGTAVLQDIFVSPVNAQVIYVLVQDKQLTAPFENSTFSIYFSTDAGQHWERHYQSNDKFFDFFGAGASFASLPGYTAPVGTVLLSFRSSGGPSSSETILLASTDEGHTFNQVGVTSRLLEVQGVAYTS